MIITYIKEKDRYVDSSGRIVAAKDYGVDFYNCKHNFEDVGKTGETIGPNGKRVPATALKCSHCKVYMVVELKK